MRVFSKMAEHLTPQQKAVIKTFYKNSFSMKSKEVGGELLVIIT